MRVTSAFVQLRSIEEHVKENHANETCTYCGKFFKGLKSFESHMKQHLDKDKMFCKNCQEFIKTKEYEDHLLRKVCHNQPLLLHLYLCSVCKKGFKNDFFKKNVKFVEKKIKIGKCKKFRCEKLNAKIIEKI